MTAMTRIFVGNLPTDIVENEVETEFASYGAVNKVEVKHKRDPLSNEIMSTFAFVTINITDSLLNQCLEEFRNEQFRGRFLTVSVARESFMEKLKREREESTQPPPEIEKTAIDPRPVVIKNPFRPQAHNKTVRTFDSEPVESNNSFSSTSDPDDCVKRKSNLFTENGKIKIPSFNDSGVVARTAPTTERKTFDEKSEKADRKRVESLINMKNTYNQQKKMVQQALANVAPSSNKKIIFDEPKNEISARPSKKSKPLFDDDGEDDDIDYAKNFEVKKQYEGESGARLQKLQSRFQNDHRFKMNENFLDDNDDGNDAEEDVTEVTESTSDERQWQYDMLESVIGKKLQPESRKKPDNLMLRYDPTKNDHEKYEKAAKRKNRSHDPEASPTKQPKLDGDGGDEFLVSKEQFFNVTNQLTSALKPAAEGFSLLAMFGRDDIADTKPSNPYQEITLSKGQQNVLLNSSSAFHDESSDEEIVRSTAVSKTVSETKQKNSKKNSKAEIWHEPFFIFGSDVRLQEGLSFFLPNSTDGITAPSEDFENKQKEMRSIIKRKIKKSIKRVIPRGAKPNKRFGRLVRDVAQ